MRGAGAVAGTIAARSSARSDAANHMRQASSRASMRRSSSTNSPKCIKMDQIQCQQARKVEANSGQWILTPRADVTFGLATVLQGVALGAEIEVTLRVSAAEGMDAGTYYSLLAVDIVFCAVFSLEYALRLRARGLRFACSRSGALDLSLCCTAGVDVALSALQEQGSFSAFRLFRLFRLVRIARVLNLFPGLQLICTGLLSTVFGIGYAMMLLGLLSYIGALLCASLLGSSEACVQEAGGSCVDDFFGSVASSFLSHIKLSFVEAWPDIARPMVVSQWIWSVYVVGFICVSNFALLNVVTGVVCETVMELARNMPPVMPEDNERRIQELELRVENIFCKALGEECRTLSGEQCLEILRSPTAAKLLRDMKIGLPLESQEVISVLAASCGGEIDMAAWTEGFMRLQGSRRDHLTQAIQYSVLERNSFISSQISKAQGSLREAMKHASNQAGLRLRQQVDSMSALFPECLSLPATPISSPSMPAKTWQSETPDGFDNACAELELQAELLCRTVCWKPDTSEPYVEGLHKEQTTQGVQTDDDLICQETGMEHTTLPAMEPAGEDAIRASRYAYLPDECDDVDASPRSLEQPSHASPRSPEQPSPANPPTGKEAGRSQDHHSEFFQRLARGQLHDEDIERLVRAGNSDHHHEVGLSRRRRIFGSPAWSDSSPIQPTPKIEADRSTTQRSEFPSSRRFTPHGRLGRFGFTQLDD